MFLISIPAVWLLAWLVFIDVSFDAFLSFTFFSCLANLRYLAYTFLLLFLLAPEKLCCCKGCFFPQSIWYEIGLSSTLLTDALRDACILNALLAMSVEIGTLWMREGQDESKGEGEAGENERGFTE